MQPSRLPTLMIVAALLVAGVAAPGAALAGPPRLLKPVEKAVRSLKYLPVRLRSALRAPPKPASDALRPGENLFRSLDAAEQSGFQGLSDLGSAGAGALDRGNRVPHNFVVRTQGNQAPVVFDLSDQRIKRPLLRKAIKIGQQSSLGPWEKIEKLQQIVGGQIKHAGNELTVEKNPNTYNRFNKRLKDSQKVARLGDYVKMHQGVCREMALLTQVALEAAGFESRLVAGDIKSGDTLVGQHVWNEVRLDGRWQIVDTTNRVFNRADAVTARTTGTRGAHGVFQWKPVDSYLKVSNRPITSELASKLLQP